MAMAERRWPRCQEVGNHSETGKRPPRAVPGTTSYHQVAYSVRCLITAGRWNALAPIFHIVILGIILDGRWSRRDASDGKYAQVRCLTCSAEFYFVARSRVVPISKSKRRVCFRTATCKIIIYSHPTIVIYDQHTINRIASGTTL